MPDDWQAARAAKFPPEVIHDAQESERTTGVPAAVTLAQWALESAFGKALAAANNPFGIKWSSTCPFPPGPPVTTRESWGGAMHVVVDRFVAFPAYKDAFDYHGKMLSRPDGYYTADRPFLHHQGEADRWAPFIDAIAHTYATDPNYAALLKGIIAEYHLADFDLAANA